MIPQRFADDEVQRGYEQWVRRLRRIELRLEKKWGHNLDVLERAGADRKSLKFLLAVAAVGYDDDSWKKTMRARMRELRSVADRMEKLAHDAEKQGNDVTSRLKFWAYLVGGGRPLRMTFPKPWVEANDPWARFIIAGMRAWAKHVRAEANLSGAFLRRRGQTDYGVILLLFRVYLWTRNTKHLAKLAELLDEALRAAGKHWGFGEETLRKIHSNHVPRMARLWVKIHDSRMEKLGRELIALLDPFRPPGLPIPRLKALDLAAKPPARAGR